MAVTFLGKSLKTPLVLASGILGTHAEILARVHACGCGLVTLKSIGPAPRDGHKNPTVLDLGCGLINAVGLPSPGYRNMEDEWEALSSRDFPIIASIYGSTPDEFATVARYVSQKGPDFIEINISCPNSERHGMIFGVDEGAAAGVTAAVRRATSLPLIAKLTPAAPDIGRIARACEDAGADAICAINTAGPGMVIDIEARRPVLAFGKGGLSGPLIKPIAVRCVYDIHQAVSIPIIGMGGITTGEDVIEMFMAGATLAGIGTAVRYRGITAFEQIHTELTTWLDAHGCTREQIIGAAHPRKMP